MLAVIFTSWPGFVAFRVVHTLDRRPRLLANAPPRRARKVVARDISDHRATG